MDIDVEEIDSNPAETTKRLNMLKLQSKRREENYIILIREIGL